VLFFGHIGITLCAGLVVNGVVKSIQKHTSLPGKTGLSNKFENSELPKPASLLGMNLTDVVFCSAGSILPDLIDKPIGQYFFAKAFDQNGRIFSHTLLFLIVIAISGIYFYLSQKKTWILYLAFGVLMHLVLDSMWQTPETLLWPFLGWHFSRSEHTDLKSWLNKLFMELTHDPSLYVPEIIGFLVGMAVLLMIIKTWVTRSHFIKRKRP
jgi:inner membrane protein